MQFWLFKQRPEALDPQAKYHSLTSGLGTNYTQPRKVRKAWPLMMKMTHTYKSFCDCDFCIFSSAFQMDIDLATSEALYGKLLQMESEVKKKLKEKQKDTMITWSQ